MIQRVRSAFSIAVGGVDPTATIERESTNRRRYPYKRPHFLHFQSEEEILVSADHHIRPIIVPRDSSLLPWHGGYAEAVNSGKSTWNEDQACVQSPVLKYPEIRDRNTVSGHMLRSQAGRERPAVALPYYYFALFDGHAGTDAALAAAAQLHHILHEKLVDILDHLLPSVDAHIMSTSEGGASMWYSDKDVSCSNLIIGAIESAFHTMDDIIKSERHRFNIKGGCTALVSLFILGKLYVANAGDSRSVLCKAGCGTPMSSDFTPETERDRIRSLAYHCPDLLGEEFTHLEFMRRPVQKDLGRRVLYRDAYMNGWAYKTVTPDDLKLPLISGEGKRSRVLATLGVTRGFGDHDLKALNNSVKIKPFLSSQPEVKIIDVENENLSDSDVLIMGTDGLWDVTNNDKAVEIVQKSLDQFPASDETKLKYRYASAAQDLVMHSRGKLKDRRWRTGDGGPASVDDISVFVIPLLPYKEHYIKWKEEYEIACSMYDTNETSKVFGKLSLRTSPINDKKATDDKDGRSLYYSVAESNIPSETEKTSESSPANAVFTSDAREISEINICNSVDVNIQKNLDSIPYMLNDSNKVFSLKLATYNSEQYVNHNGLSLSNGVY